VKRFADEQAAEGTEDNGNNANGNQNNWDYVNIRDLETIKTYCQRGGGSEEELLYSSCDDMFEEGNVNGNR